MSSYRVPPVAAPDWNWTPSRISSSVKAALSKSDSLYDRIASLPKNERDYESVIRAIALREGEMSSDVEPATFMQYVSTDADVRNASVEADKEAQEWGTKSLTRVDVYEAILDAQERVRANGAKLTAEEERLMDRLVSERKRNGLGLSQEKRDEYVKLKQEITRLEIDFQKNCNEESGTLSFTKEELDGVPQDVIEGYTEEGDKYTVTFKTPDVFPIFKFAKNAETRKAATLGYEDKTAVNTPLLAEIIALRQKAAKLLGYENWAEWVLEVKMAKDGKTVMGFLNDLLGQLKPVGMAEREKLLQVKKQECEERGIPFDNKFHLWDYRYYDRLFIEKTLSLDQQKVQEYFPVSVVVPFVLDTYKHLLNVEFQRVPNEHGGATWHEDAEMYAVWDAGNGQEKGHFLGYMHLDLFPRANKFGHAAVWGLVPGFNNAQNERQYPVVSMVANLAKPTPTRPALMQHQDVVTFFHECGHAFHGLCSGTQFARFDGTSVARDFVEAPSQMLENWCWTHKILKEMSSHYQREAESMPDDMIASLIKSQNVNQGLFNLRQLFFGLFDMTVHTKDADSPEMKDLTKLWCDLREEVSLVTTDGEYRPGQSGFAHITGGYSAGYYGYLYSKVFSADMFKTVFEKDPMDKEAGRRYREEILRPGGSRDEMDSLKAFLGREPNNKAFLESLVGTSDARL